MFYRVFQNGETAQTALIMLNKGSDPAEWTAPMVSVGHWIDALTGDTVEMKTGVSSLTATIPSHGVKVWI
jgi:cyclomaltodextrin glucanotransferase